MPDSRGILLSIGDSFADQTALVVSINASATIILFITDSPQMFRENPERTRRGNAVSQITIGDSSRDRGLTIERAHFHGCPSALDRRSLMPTHSMARYFNSNVGQILCDLLGMGEDRHVRRLQFGNFPSLFSRHLRRFLV